ncbi:MULTISPECIES: isoprenoid biosynthesis glyoxalase ElbB [unclassified Lentimonas]|uniref:isoprenoid biosynthesis glyoxalase ElbB n=1 Tax=unclassified Lentimonas TaxID=2630993 RepID=UPI0013281E3F|nr:MULTISPECIES: isoprenoid biosynthesis glyoxalase ElbB [unclassified Lentimonas]CAA6695395.1 Sigma cross-reacting protein 27A [Lentimonas sp. CC10]CAA6695804.1 Sigma cross-reacting protein 27A [Lentimonas sp. CC19]CAA7072040.1 Sigma cross-reacting protein 27A [Lentimonas sp. CC11]
MQKQAKVAVILSGCGVFDGAEIHESVLTLLALARAGAKVTCAAPDITQRHVINHATGEIAEDEDRNVLEEAARISRGEIKRINELRLSELDAIIFVGGFGVAKNLSSLAFDGKAYDIDPIIHSFIQEAHQAHKALGFMCIAPALAASALGANQVRLTIGNDADTAAILESKGAQHINCSVNEIVVDTTNRVVTTPAYMLAEDILQAEAGINKLITELLKLI